MSCHFERVSTRQKIENLKFVRERRNSLRVYQANLERVLANQKEVSIIGEIITMNTKVLLSYFYLLSLFYIINYYTIFFK